jgi:hypothetical protein
MTVTDPRVTGGDGCAGTPHTRAHMEIEPADPSPAVTGRPSGEATPGMFELDALTR